MGGGNHYTAAEIIEGGGKVYGRGTAESDVADVTSRGHNALAQV